jgi:hypothetical protein
MYGLFNIHQARHQVEQEQLEEQLEEEESERRRPQKDEAKDQFLVEEAVNAVLKQHHEAILPQKKECLLFLRRDSYSTFTTAVETPENSIGMVVKTATSSQHRELLPHEMTICFPKEEREDSFFGELPLILQKAKFLPDPMNVGDFYGDDDVKEEDIIFVPDVHHQETTQATPTLRKPSSHPSVANEDNETAAERSKKPTRGGRPRTLRRHGSGGLECIRPPVRDCLPPLLSMTRMEI